MACNCNFLIKSVHFAFLNAICLQLHLTAGHTWQKRLPMHSRYVPPVKTGLGHCNHTKGDLLSIHVCRDTIAMNCSTGQGKLHSPMFSAALQYRLTAGLGHCNHTKGDLLFIQLCGDTIAMNCSTGQGKLHSPLFSAALQLRLTPGLGHCNHTSGDWLFIQVCRDTTEINCSTG